MLRKVVKGFIINHIFISRRFSLNINIIILNVINNILSYIFLVSVSRNEFVGFINSFMSYYSIIIICFNDFFLIYYREVVIFIV